MDWNLRMILVLPMLLGYIIHNRLVYTEYIAREGLLSQNANYGVDHFEMMRKMHSELIQLKQDQEKMKSVQAELLTTKKELLKTQKELGTSQEKFLRAQRELKSRVDVLEEKNRHLEVHVRKLITSCKVDIIPETSTFTGELGVGHGPNDRNSTSSYLQVDKTGNGGKVIIRRTTLKGVGFTARLTDNILNMGSQQIIVFDNVYMNTGNGYEARSGIFHAPVAGMYVILVTIASENVDLTPLVEVVHNGSPLCRTTAPVKNWGGSPCNAIAHLNAGDAVWIRLWYLHPGSMIRGSYFSTFSVGLISNEAESSSS